MGFRTFVPLVAACPGCGRTTSTVFQELARDIQDWIADAMPGWKTQLSRRREPERRGDGLHRQRAGRIEACRYRHLAARHRRDAGRAGLHRRPEGHDAARRRRSPQEFKTIVDDYIDRRYGPGTRTRPNRSARRLSGAVVELAAEIACKPWRGVLEEPAVAGDGRREIAARGRLKAARRAVISELGGPPRNLHHAARASPRCRARRLRARRPISAYPEGHARPVSGRWRSARSASSTAISARARSTPSARRSQHGQGRRRRHRRRGLSASCLADPLGADADRDAEIRRSSCCGRQQRRGRLAVADGVGPQGLTGGSVVVLVSAWSERPCSTATRRSRRRSPCSRQSRG